MLDITAVPARSVICPFSVLALDTAVPCNADGSLLFLVGCENACVALLQGGKLVVCKFLSQYHRTLTAGACRSVGPDGSCVFVLADSASALTLHRICRPALNAQSTDHISSTVFVGDLWDSTPRIGQVVSVWGGCGSHYNRSGLDFICTRHGEAGGIVWGISVEREDARMVRVDDSLMRLFPPAPQQNQHSAPECFLGATLHGVSLISPITGDTLLNFKLPDKMEPVVAVQADGSGMPWYAMVTASGVALVYDQRRTEQPIWSKSLVGESKFAFANCDDVEEKKRNGGMHSLVTSCGDGVWAICSAGRFHFLRCTDGSVSHRHFFPHESLVPARLSTAGLYFTDGVLYVVVSK